MTGNILSAGQAAFVLFGVFFALLIIRVPVAFALGLACLPILMLEPRLSPMMLAQETFNAYNSFILLAVPFFLLTANLMSIGGITDRLVTLSKALVGHWPGSLAQINVVLSVFFAGISGSSTADAASQSKIFIDAQTKEGYDLSFSIAITAVSAVLAVIIPPSILMIVWGGLISTSIGAMYLAGIVPGLLIAGAQMVTVHVYAVKRGYPTYPRMSWTDLRCAVWHSLPALMTPFIIVGGILLGWFTATESAAIAVLYSIALSAFYYREIGPKELYKALLDTGRLASVALFCVGTASAFGWLLAFYKIPQTLLANVSTWGMGPITAGFFIAFCFLVVGCFLDAIPAIVIVGTVLEPLARSVDLHPVQFAIISIVSLAFGLVTPPYGLCLMIACAVAGVRLRYALKDTLIMLVPMMVVLAALVVWPDLCLFLPKMLVPNMLK
ncbi:MAG: TRAP transporter large permease [Hyphomicrobiales bacterium]|nr:TRAP transporter large permease [Hyphomicrobiales bacterium]